MIFSYRIPAIVFYVCHQKKRAKKCIMARMIVWIDGSVNLFKGGTNSMVFPDRNAYSTAISKANAQSPSVRDIARVHCIWGNNLHRKRSDHWQRLLKHRTLHTHHGSFGKNKRKTSVGPMSRDSLTSIISTYGRMI